MSTIHVSALVALAGLSISAGCQQSTIVSGESSTFALNETHGKRIVFSSDRHNGKPIPHSNCYVDDTRFSNAFEAVVGDELAWTFYNGCSDNVEVSVTTPHLADDTFKCDRPTTFVVGTHNTERLSCSPQSKLFPPDTDSSTRREVKYNITFGVPGVAGNPLMIDPEEVIERGYGGVLVMADPPHCEEDTADKTWVCKLPESQPTVRVKFYGATSETAGRWIAPVTLDQVEQVRDIKVTWYHRTEEQDGSERLERLDSAYYSRLQNCVGNQIVAPDNGRPNLIVVNAGRSECRCSIDKITAKCQ